MKSETVSARLDNAEVGQLLPALALPPVTRASLALYAGASGDHNPLHIDSDLAKSAGLADVFAQGMLGMAWAGRAITRWAPQTKLRKFRIRFLGIIQVGDELTCNAVVSQKVDVAGQPCVVLDLSVTDRQGHVRMAGSALVAVT